MPINLLLNRIPYAAKALIISALFQFFDNIWSMPPTLLARSKLILPTIVYEIS